MCSGDTASLDGSLQSMQSSVLDGSGSSPAPPQGAPRSSLKQRAHITRRMSNQSQPQSDDGSSNSPSRSSTKIAVVESVLEAATRIRRKVAEAKRLAICAGAGSEEEQKDVQNPIDGAPQDGMMVR